MIRVPQLWMILLFVVSIQPSVVISQTSYPKGVYKDLNALCTKSPDQGLWQEVTVVRRSPWLIWLFGGNNYAPFAEVKWSEYRTWYAISDGESLYVNCGKQKNQQFGYAKVNSEGRYLSYTGVMNWKADFALRITTFLFTGPVGELMFAAPFSLLPVEYYFDTQTGVNRPLDKTQIQYLLTKDLSLGESFERETKRNRSMRAEYIDRLNKSPITLNSVAGAGCSAKKPAQLFLYRLDKKSKLDEHIILYGSDTIAIPSKSLKWIEFDERFKKLEIRLLNGSTKTIHLNPGQSEYIRIRHRRRGSVMESKTWSQGTHDIERARKAQARRWRKAWRSND
ncbi:MAG: DUF6563 family protein [Flavobacteriales bacterium]